MRPARLFMTVGIAFATMATVLPQGAEARPARPASLARVERTTSPAAPAVAPTCMPGKPVVVGANGTSLTVTVPPCADQTGLIGYRIFVLATAANTALKQVDVPLSWPQQAITGLAAGTLYRFRIAARSADGVGPQGPASTDSSPPFTSLSAMVDRQYLDFTTVAPTSAQRSTWLADLASGSKTPVDLVDALERSDYWKKQDGLIRLYKAYFLRLPDKSGMAYWMGKYRGGLYLWQISQTMASSSEFKTRYGALTNRQFVEKIYLNVLGRAGDAAGINSWVLKLENGSKNRGQVMVGFSEGSEYVRKMASTVWTINLFTGMVRRLPTTAEVTTWTAKTKAELIVFLLADATYVSRVGTIAPPAVTTPSLAGGTVGNSYAQSLEATGGSGALSWTLASGTLPPGLSLSSAGSITGTPTKGGTFSITVRVTDAGARTGTKAFTIAIPPLIITTTSLPDGDVGVTYPTTVLNKFHNWGTVTWSLASGTLPAGLTLSTAGIISGKPTASGTKTFVVKATDAGGSTATKQFSIVIGGIKIATASLPDGTVGTAYPNTQLTATNTSGTLFWEVTVGDLPPGLSLAASGAISGTPTAGGTFTFTVQVTDDASNTGTKALSISIPALAITTSSVPDGVITTPYADTQLDAANAYGGVTWSVSAGALPTGLTLSSDGVLAGTPSTGGPFTFTAQVQDSGGATATKQFSFNVASFAITTTGVPGGFIGIPYSFVLEAAGGSGYSWSITSGSLPPGLTLAGSTGVISGTPTTAATSTFTVKVDASGGKTASKTFSTTIETAADWPQARRDDGGRSWNPNETAINSANVPGIDEEWSFEGTLSPVIAGTYAYAAGEVPGHTGTFAPMALDLSTGDVVWYGPSLPAGCNSAPVAVTTTAVIAQCSTLVAYDRGGTHQVLWDTASTDPGTSINQFLVSGSSAVAWTSDRVLGYRLSDGQRLWQQLLPSGTTAVSDVAASGSSVAIAYDTRLRVLSLSTGAQSWIKTVTSPAEVMIADGWVYTRAGGGVSRFALADGTAGWSVLAGTGIYDLVGVDSDTVYAFEAVFGDFGQDTAVLRALKTSDGSQRWQHDLSTRIRGAAVTGDLVWVLESQIFSWGRDSNLIAFRRSDGAERKRVHFDDNSYGTAAFGNGHIIFAQGGSSGGPDPHRLRSYGFTPPTPKMTSRIVPTGRVGVAYSSQLTAAGGTGAITWSYTGTLPTGLALGSNGILSGTPTGASTTRIQVKVTDANGRNRTRSLLIQVLAAGGTNTWNGDGHGPTRDGFNPVETTIGRTTAAQLGYRWITATPAGTEQGIVADHQPTVAGGKVFDADKIGRLAAYSTSGTTANRLPLWTLTALDGAAYLDAPIESGGTLYLMDSNRNVDAVRASDGVRLWHKPGGPVQYQRNEVVVIGTRLLFLNSDYDMVALNTSDGSPSWGGAATALDGNELLGSVQIASDGVRAFVLANCELKAITAATGAVAWTQPVKEGGTSGCGAGGKQMPMVADGAVFANTYDGSIAVEAATGLVRWRAGTHGGYGNGGGVIANGVWVLADSGVDEGDMAALDLATGEVLWQTDRGYGYEQFATAGDLIVASKGSSLFGFDLLTGEQIWDGGVPDASGYTNGGTSIADGKIFVSTRDGIKAYGLP